MDQSESDFSLDLDDLDGDVMSEQEDTHMILLESTAKPTSVWQVASLSQSSVLHALLQRIAHTSINALASSIEHDEFRQIIDANDFIQQAVQDTQKAHSFLKDNYTRFPELEAILPTPIDHARAILLIQNTHDIDQAQLKTILQSTTALIVNVAFTTTKGTLLSPTCLAAVVEACQVIIDLEATKHRLLVYVQSRMTLIAPNLSAIIGSYVAAQLMSVAGGILILSSLTARPRRTLQNTSLQHPSTLFRNYCIIKVLGKKESINTGFSRVAQNKHAGFIHYSDLVMRIQEEYRPKATRIISAKVALAVRIDVSKESPDGIHGMNMLLDIQKKIQTMLEPPPGKAIKALPVPLEGPKKRRAGKKVSNQKQKFAQSEVQKQQNRMEFNVQEQETGGSLGFTEGLGMLTGATGNVRSTVQIKRKIGLSKQHKQMTERLNAAVTDGFTTSLSTFTPVQGLALENPEARKKLKIANDKWFSVGKKE